MSRAVIWPKLSAARMSICPKSRGGSVSIYLAFPQDRIASHGPALGLIVNQTITGVARSSDEGEALFLLDEFANLGRLSGLAESLTALPGLGVRVWMLVQELAELTRIYGPHTTKTILSQSEVQQFFAVGSDEMDADALKGLGPEDGEDEKPQSGAFRRRRDRREPVRDRAAAYAA